jgi:glycosyltransferase involved in cell wall biosynthesis
MIAIVITAHNESACLADCLASVRAAARHPELGGEEVRIWLVADACADNPETVAQMPECTTIAIQAQNAGIARATGAEAALASGARWLAFTDADCSVRDDWLVKQLTQFADLVCGTVSIDDWGPYGSTAKRYFQDRYLDTDGHGHVHGENLGISADTYLRTGGFLPMPTGEDGALVMAAEKIGARIAWSAQPRVAISARPNACAANRLGYQLQGIARHLAAMGRKHGASSTLRLNQSLVH